MRAYLTTGETKYLGRLDLDLRDWLIASGGKPSPEGFGTSHLEPAIRMPRWARIFYGLQQCEGFQPATRLLMLTTIAEHAEYLLEHPGHGNWVAMTQYGAITGGICWPEFKRANIWCSRAISRLQQNANNTIYPDGAQKELTAHYHMVTLRNYDQVFNLLRKAEREIPRSFSRTVQDMWNYIAYVLRPDGTRPLNNDSDLGSQREQLIEAASMHDRSDWLFIATNGSQGQKPEDPPSRCFPWAGQLVSRNGWNSDAHWSFFDVGPSGLGHRHFDFGHISINAFGRHLLIDSGRFAYQGKIARQFRQPYASHTRGHNTVLVDGQTQGANPKIVNEPIQEFRHWKIEDNYDFARGSWEDYENISGSLIHYRSLLYLRNKGWIVVDRIETDRSRKLQPLWHFHPDCIVQNSDLYVYTNNRKANISITPLGQINWDLDIIEGQKKPHPQGWYSKEYGRYVPAPCVRYTGSISKTSTFAWLIWPGKTELQVPNARLEEDTEEGIVVKLIPAHGEKRTIFIPVKNGKIKFQT